MDLQTLQSQLRNAIQNHQIVVAKMRSDPQSTTLQKQLHDLQAEIMQLSDKQKQVVQQLRKELEKMQQATINKSQNSVQVDSRNSVTTKNDNHIHQHPTEKIQISPKHRNAVSVKHGYQKKSFMAALGLITKDTLKELQSKRFERKRRTTANPQFSNAAVEERKRNAALQNNDPVSSQPFKRPRGRPRLNATPNNSRPTTPESTSSNGVENLSVNGGGVSPQSQQVPVSETAAQQQATCSQQQKPDVPKFACDVCNQHGGLLPCSVCGKVFHLSCLQPPLTAVPESSWTCAKCQSAKPTSSQLPETLAVVHSYIALKTAKEEEKRKLMRRSMELKTELQQLQDRVHQLKDAISGQNKVKAELQEKHQKTQESIEKLCNVVAMFKNAS